MRERDVEAELVRRVAAQGGVAWKWVSPGQSGVPDRIVLMPGGRLVFVELKRPGEEPEPIQDWVAGKLRDLGFRVEVVDSKAGARALAEELG